MRHPKDMSRRQFLARAGGAAIAMPSLAAILAACSKPSAGGGLLRRSRSRSRRSRTRSSCRRRATRSRPTRRSSPARSSSTTGTTTCGSRSSSEFEDKFGVTVDVTAFKNMEEGIQKVSNGQVLPDVFVPTPGYLRRLVEKDLLQPLQHELIPNMGERLADLLEPGPVLRPRLALHGAVHDLHVGRCVPPRPSERRRRCVTGLGSAVEPRLRGRDQPLRLVRRHDRYHDPAQREPRGQHERSSDSSTPPRKPSSRRSTTTRRASRSTACTPSSRRASSRSRSRGQATSSGRSGTCERATVEDPRLLASRDGQDHDRQRHCSRSRRTRRTRGSHTSSSTSFSTSSTGPTTSSTGTAISRPFTSINPKSLIADGRRAQELGCGGRHRGHVQEGPHADRVGPDGGPAVARCLDGDQGRGLSWPS